MRKVLVTQGKGAYAELLDISRPGYQRYARRHGYKYHELRNTSNDRPASWTKMPHLSALLEEYDQILWLGCDVLIVNGEEDIAAHTPDDAWQGMVAHHVGEGEVPNCDVWLLRKPMIPYLSRAWSMEQYVNHPWWEQAAIIDLMGYDMTTRPLAPCEPTELYQGTHFLPLEWNSHESSDRHPSPRFAHATYGPVSWRANVMRKYQEMIPVE